MPSFEIRKSITINRPSRDVIAFLSDFRNWPMWSPWLILESDCTLEFMGDQGEIGASYLWNGQRIGSGNMTLMEKDSNSLAFELHFLKPFESKASVGFEILNDGSHSIVTWFMQGNLPWYFLPFKSKIKVDISLDYRRGLIMLKRALESGQVTSELTLIGETPLEELKFIGVKARSTLDDLEEDIQLKYQQTRLMFEQKNLPIKDNWYVLIEERDKTTGEVEFLVCFPTEQSVNIEPPFIMDELQPTSLYTVEHHGENQFLQNAWAYNQSLCESLKIKHQSSPFGIECRKHSPDQSINTVQTSQFSFFL